MLYPRLTSVPIIKILTSKDKNLDIILIFHHNKYLKYEAY